MGDSLRSPSSQGEHDQVVKRIADDYRNKKYIVHADISGYRVPASINGYQPDVRARLKYIGFEVVVEVETPDSVNSDYAKEQDNAFKNWEHQDPQNRSYRHIVTSYSFLL